MSCRNTQLPDGRVRRFDITAATIMAEAQRNASAIPEVPVTIETASAPEAAAAPSRTREICISAGILVTIVGTLSLVVVFFG